MPKSYQFTGMDSGHLGQEVQIIVIQSGRYNKYPNKLSESKQEYVLRKYSVNVDEIGAYSARKGTSIYMTSVCVNGPMQQAVNIRCGWRMGGVTDYWCRYDAAGDQYCCRIVAGLPLFSFRFAVLPPKCKLETELENEMLSDLILTLLLTWLRTCG